jgi:flagellar motor switch protein FliM
MTQNAKVDTVSANLVDEIIRMSNFNFERLPMLDVIAERMVENLTAVFPDLTRVMCDVSLVSLEYLPMGEIIESLPSPVFFAVADGEPFEGEILLVLDQSLLMTSVELMLGGKAHQIKNLGDETHEFTAIELRFGERLASTIFSVLERSFSVVTPTKLGLDRVETNSDGAIITKNASLCARLRFNILQAGQVGTLDLVIPYDALEPILPDGGRMYFGVRTSGENSWQAIISSQIKSARMDLEVVLTETSFPIQKIMSWKPGDTIDLGIEDGVEALMTCADSPIFKVSLGKRNNGFVAVQITEKLAILEESENDDDDN